MRKLEESIRKESRLPVCAACGWFGDRGVVKHDCWPKAGEAVDALIERTGTERFASKLGYGEHCFALDLLDAKGRRLLLILRCREDSVDTGFTFDVSAWGGRAFAESVVAALAAVAGVERGCD